ncbi:CBS domain-containing protein [Reichenbachiella versicolor]|uniref:CBS domain-containing protein n=1 Tax=Reichenbachiella versicolor TaxID=1821036 RepID=UPI000D6E099E|nr:CBS domain-containing protein [Reichenbachiella versicolor]
MRAKDLINYSIPPLKLKDNVDRAQQWMGEFHIHELPVVDQGKFLGLFNENLLFDEFSGAETIEDIQIVGSQVFVDQNEHYYDVIKRAYDSNSNLVAVVNENEEYIGAITIQDVVEAFSKMSSIQSPGVIIIISMNIQDYSMTELSRIVETEDGKVLSSFIEDFEGQSGTIRVTLKIDPHSSNAVISSFGRHGYNIVSTFGLENEDDYQKERLDTLLKYLEI